MSHLLDTLWYTRSPHPSPLGLASQLGWFLEEFSADDIKVFTLQESDDPHMRDSHLDHHLTNSIRQGGNVPAIWARARGARTHVIGLSWIDEYQVILARPHAGIESPKQLRGRRVGLPLYASHIESRRAEALHGFIVALEGEGLQAGDVEFIDIAIERPPLERGGSAPPGPYGEYARLVEALLAGQIDAIYVKGARGLRAMLESGARVVLDIRRHPDPLLRMHTGTPRPITVDETLLRTHPDVVQRFLARVVAVGDWAAAHPDETLCYVSRETRSTVPLVRAAYGDDLHRRLDTNLDPVSIRALEAQKNFLLKWGFVQHDFDVASWFDPAPLEAVRRSLPATAASAALV